MPLILWKNVRQWINNNIKIFVEMNGSTRLIDYPRIHIFRHFVQFLFTYLFIQVATIQKHHLAIDMICKTCLYFPR